jgi:hypothetical protein
MRRIAPYGVKSSSATLRARIQQASFQSHDDALGMQGGYIGFPTPYLDVEGTAFEFALCGPSCSFLRASRRLRAYGRNDSLRGNDLDTALCELLPHRCRQDIRDGDAPRTVCIKDVEMRRFRPAGGRLYGCSVAAP